MDKITQELLNQILNSSEIISCVGNNEQEFLSETVRSYLTRIAKEKQMIVADIAQNSTHGDYVYKVFQGMRNASRDILLAIALGMSMTDEQVGRLLRIAGFAQLDPRNRRDSVIIYAVVRKMSVDDTNDILYELKEALL